MVDSEDIFTPQLLDNIKFGFISTGVLGLIIAVLILAWISTGLAPLNYYVWLVQLHTLPARRIIQVFTMNDESSNGLIDTALNETPSQLVAEELNRNNPNSSEENGEESSNQTTVVIIQPPSSITNRNDLSTSTNTFASTVQSRGESSQQQTSSSIASGQDAATGNYRFELPAESGEDINQIHRFLRANTDNAIATAATIALYNRRMNEQAANPNNRLLVSSVSMSIESEENHPTQNILISYDNLQPVASTHEETTSTVHTNTSDSDSYTDGESSASSTTATGSTNHDPTTTDEEEPENIQSSSTNTQKNTANINPTEESDLTIKLKFLDDTHRLVKTWLTTTVGDFKRNNFSDTLTTGKVVRLIYQGQLLRDDSRSLASYGIHDQCVVHCHVGNRPYVQGGTASVTGQNTNSSSLPNQGITGLRQSVGTNATTFGARILSTGISWADILLLAVWNVLFSVYNWAQAVDNNNNTSNPTVEEHMHPWGRRALEGVRRALRLVLNCLFDPTMRPTANTDDPFGNRFNAGALIGLLFALKFLTMWLFVLYFPQFSNPSTIVLLTILTVVMGSYFFFNRQMGGEGGNNVQQMYHNH